MPAAAPLNPIEYYGDRKMCMLMSMVAAQDYKAANPDIGAMKVLTGWPTFSMTAPDDYQTPPVIDCCGKSGEYPMYAMME